MAHFRSASLFVLATLTVVGCSKSQDPAPTAKPSSVATTTASVATPPAPSAATLAAGDSGAPSGLVDLLYETPSTVAVSSRVDNPKDFPEHLVDRRPETAWNGKSGDLVGGWMAFRVPEDAQVKEVLLTVGFDRKSEKEDLFTSNVRVTKVRISRAGKPLREVALDPELRTPQAIAVGTAGGAFRLEVLAVLAGSKPTWKELTISELVVRGTPGKARKKKAGAPRVLVGGLDAATPRIKTFASAEAACTKLVSDAKAALEEDKSSPWHTSGDPIPEATCARGKGPLAPPHEPALEVFPLGVEVTPPGPYSAHFAGDLLAVRTSAGIVTTDIRVKGKETATLWSVDYTLESLTWAPDAHPSKLVARVKEHRIAESDGYAEPGHESELRSDTTTTRVIDCSFGDVVECR
jgi:hypothetical protein